MAALTSTDIADLVAATLYELGPARFQNIAQNYQHLEVFSKWFKKDKVAFESGIGIQRTLLNRLATGAARHVGLLESDVVNIQDVLDQMQVPWRQLQTSWGLIYQTDVLENSGKAQIVSTIKARRAGALLALAEELEAKAWGDAPGTTNKTDPYGVKYWVVQNGTAGFNGGAPGSHTTVAGVSLTDSPKFKNYTDDYTSITKTDLITKMRTAHRKIRFVSPLEIKDYRNGLADRYRIYTNEDGISGVESLGEAQNENLGRDIASMDGTMIFRKHPIIWVPYLDSDTTDPFYMLDHSTFYPVCLKGDYLRESEAMRSPDNHNVFNVFVDLRYNYVCVDRRRNAVIAKVP